MEVWIASDEGGILGVFDTEGYANLFRRDWMVMLGLSEEDSFGVPQIEKWTVRTDG